MNRKDLPPGFKRLTCPCGCKVDLAEHRIRKDVRAGTCRGCGVTYVSPKEGAKA